MWQLPVIDNLEGPELERLPAHLIVVKRRRFTLTLFKRAGREFYPEHKCRIAIGAVGFSTPTGPHVVLRKESPPSYTAPKSAWAQAAGYVANEKLAPDDPANPLRGAFLWIDDEGHGIHGTPNLLSLGTRASHGCIRVSEEDALILYRLVEVGTPVVIQ